MDDERETRRAESEALRERVRALHARGTRVHERFLEAVVRQDGDGMREAANEHAAINRETIGLIATWRARLVARLGR